MPELEQLAYQKYQDEGTALLNRLSALQAMEDQDYARYRDQINDYYTDQTFNYQKEQDALSQKNWQAPVSYTHLDVYKRQVLFFCPNGGGDYEMEDIPVPARAGQQTGAPAMLLL